MGAGWTRWFRDDGKILREHGVGQVVVTHAPRWFAGKYWPPVPVDPPIAAAPLYRGEAMGQFIAFPDLLPTSIYDEPLAEPWATIARLGVSGRFEYRDGELYFIMDDAPVEFQMPTMSVAQAIEDAQVQVSMPTTSRMIHSLKPDEL